MPAAAPGSSLYFATELLKAKTGIKINIVNYRGAGPALNDLLGGHIDGMFDAMPVMAPQAKEGKVTPLAVTSAKRSSALPNVPTIKESGVSGLRDVRLVRHPGAAPARPPAIAQKLRDEVAKAVADPAVIKTLDEQGMEPLATQPGEWAKYIESELEVYTKITKDANIAVGHLAPFKAGARGERAPRQDDTGGCHGSVDEGARGWRSFSVLHVGDARSRRRAGCPEQANPGDHWPLGRRRHRRDRAARRAEDERAS